MWTTSLFSLLIILLHSMRSEGFYNTSPNNIQGIFHPTAPAQHFQNPTCSTDPSNGFSRISWRAVKDSKTNDIKTSELFSLDSIRSTLVRQEETIIFALIERAQFRRNPDIYDPKYAKLTNIYGTPISFFEWMMIETEKLHAKVRRYTSPEEHPFFEYLLPPPMLPDLQYPELLSVKKSEVNVNHEIMRWYVEKIIDRLCISGDDEQHGSSVITDINALQAISRRVHMGKFVAESKYQSNPDVFNQLVKDNNVVGIVNQLTNVEVERSVLRRAFVKASHYGRDITGHFDGSKIDPMLIVDIYRDMVIPLTKDVEIRYIFLRAGQRPPAPDTYFEHCRGPLDAFEDLEALKKYYLPVAPELKSSISPDRILPPSRASSNNIN
mmetsp:Transcript_7940/g.8689  ORF Transcript_7940/g.8689 Transcript_7940/m.8689 type:complete len:381 (-) Transcript_7940:49-1191(-)